MSQLELDEYVIACNAQIQVQNQGSALDRFMGRSVMTAIPNSFESLFQLEGSNRSKGGKKRKKSK